jgi:iron complex outermembrane receptor protein
MFLLMHCASAHAENEDFSTMPDSKLHVLIEDGRTQSRVGGIDKEITSSAYSVINAERFQNTFTSLSEILEQEVGVQMRPSGGVGSLSTVILRGASSEQVVVYLDGVPLNDAAGGPVDLSLIPIASIESIEIYRGSTPLALGNPSIGGAINIITKRRETTGDDQKDASGQLSASIGSFHTYQLSGISSLTHDKDDFLLTASYLQSENDFPYVNDNGTQFNPLDDREEDRHNDGVKHLTLLSSWKHRISKRVNTEFKLDLIDRSKEIPGVTNSPDVQAVLDTRQFNLLGQINARDVWSKNINVNVKFFARRKDEVFDDSLAQIGFFNQHKESVTEKLGAQFYSELNQQQAQWKVLLGLSRETYDSESSLALSESGTNSRNQVEVSAENISYFNDDHLIVNFLLRYQIIDDELSSVTDGFGTVTPAVENSYDFLNPQIGMKYRFNKRTFVTANIGLYDRVPSFFELFGGDGLLLGNPDLKPENSVNIDAGFTYTWYQPSRLLHDTEIYLGVFSNKIEDLIVRIYNGAGVGVPQNISDALIRGFESTIKFFPAKNHSVNINLSLIDSVNQSDVGSFDGKILPGYYQQSVSLRYAYSINRWLFGAEADIKRNMFYDRSNLLEGDDVNLINLTVRRYFQSSNIDFRINNILDENIQYLRNRPTPGLNFFLTYNYTF